MKATLIHDAQAANPLYLSASREERKTMQPFLTLPAGHVVEHPDCWRDCAIGTMAPADDECRERVVRHLGNPRRKQLLAKIRALRKADGVKQLDAKSKQWLEYMETAYAVELDREDDETE